MLSFYRVVGSEQPQSGAVFENSTRAMLRRGSSHGVRSMKRLVLTTASIIALTLGGAAMAQVSSGPGADTKGMHSGTNSTTGNTGAPGTMSGTSSRSGHSTDCGPGSRASNDTINGSGTGAKERSTMANDCGSSGSSTAPGHNSASGNSMEKR
jgi:hypothetical protein